MPIPIARRLQRSAELLFVLLAGLLVAQLVRVGLFHYGFGPFRIILTGALLVMAWGLLRAHPLARRAAAMLCIGAAFLVPLGKINPFAARDLMAAGLTPPGAGEILVWVIPLEIFLLASAYVLDLRIPASTPTA